MNRTASVNHASLSDKAHEAGLIDPLPSTLDLIAKIRKDNEAIRDAETRIGLKMTIAEMKTFLEEREQLDAYAAELREGREAWNMERIPHAVLNYELMFISPDNENFSKTFVTRMNEKANGHLFAAGIFAAQIAANRNPYA